ncbi:hypothetical protein BK146_15090 [Paenibacillus sp. FSL R7-0333]|nr:hypothetical protein BK146_15090 [Paenibacillus sp. FSL R7-0333]
MACGPNVLEKPTTLGLAVACGPNVIEKPITFSLAVACGPNVIEKPITFGVAVVSAKDAPRAQKSTIRPSGGIVL